LNDKRKQAQWPAILLTIWAALGGWTVTSPGVRVGPTVALFTALAAPFLWVTLSPFGHDLRRFLCAVTQWITGGGWAGWHTIVRDDDPTITAPAGADAPGQFEGYRRGGGLWVYIALARSLILARTVRTWVTGKIRPTRPVDTRTRGRGYWLAWLLMHTAHEGQFPQPSHQPARRKPYGDGPATDHRQR
jgi:hypothetical protein